MCKGKDLSDKIHDVEILLLNHDRWVQARSLGDFLMGSCLKGVGGCL